MEKLLIIDYDNGIVIDEINEGDKFSIKRKSQIEWCNNHIKINSNKSFIKLYNDNLFKLLQEDLTKGEFKIMLTLSNYISFNSGLLKINNDKYINNEDIIKLTGFSKKTVVEAMQKLVRLQIFGKHRTGRENCYTANPFIFMKGQTINSTLYNLYKKSKWNNDKKNVK